MSYCKNIDFHSLRILRNYLFIFQDIKYSALFKADAFLIEATDFYLEPLASFQCIATAPSGGIGQPTVKSAGAGHATLGGGCKYIFTEIKTNI